MLGNDDPPELAELLDGRRGASTARARWSAGRRARDDQLGLLEHDTVAYLPGGDEQRAGGGHRRAWRTQLNIRSGPSSTCTRRRVHPARRRARPRRRAPGAGRARPGPVRRRSAAPRCATSRSSASRCSGCTATSTSRRASAGWARKVIINPGSDYSTGRAQRRAGHPGQGPRRRPAGPRLMHRAGPHGADPGADPHGADPTAADPAGRGADRRRRRHVRRPRVRVRGIGRAAGRGPPPLSDVDPADGWAEQDAPRWRRAALSALGALVRSSGRTPGPAVGVTGQCPCVVPLEPARPATRPGIIYRDNRATAEADCAAGEVRRPGLHALTGHVPTAFHVAAKVVWIRTHGPAMFAATRRFVQPSEYVAPSP